MSMNASERVHDKSPISKSIDMCSSVSSTQRKSMMKMKHKTQSAMAGACAAMVLATSGLTGCSDDDSPPVAITPQNLTCDDSMKTAFKPDANTSVTLVKAFKKGDALLLSGTATSTTPIADNDVCVVKLVVGPGKAGPADAPSTSAGIGIEVWLPSAVNWNKRLHALGGGGCSREGSNVISLTVLGGTRGSTVGQSPAIISTGEGAVSAMTDLGHTKNDCDFAMNPDGTINSFGWTDFSERAIREEVVKAKALAKAYYGNAPAYSYWDGFSTGGRQGHKFAQAFPAEVNGILAGAPVINWTKLQTAEAYPQIVYQRDLGGVALTSGQLTLLGNAAINACDLVGGAHLGYIPDPSQCRYNPTTDLSVICQANGGTNTTANCVTPAQAQVQNKLWYGPTFDGSVPSPAADNGWALVPGGSQLWYGQARGAGNGNAGSSPFSVSTDNLALMLQDPKIATPSFINASSNGQDGWKTLTYPQLANALYQGVVLQPQFANINTDNPDLSALKSANTKLLAYHGQADQLVPSQGTINYYNRVAAQMGGISEIQNYYRFYLVSGMAHALANGTTNTNANPPLPTHAQLYQALTDWVEKGVAPGRIDISTVASTTFPTVKSRPLCLYPQKATYVSGDPNTAASYICS